ncbi:unnamed protein product [Alternaria alternata]
MVAAGLLEILVDVLKLRTAKAERNHPKILNFLDTFVYNLRDAFSALVAAKGLEIIADLMQYEVDTSKKLAEEDKGMPKEYKTQLTDYQIPFYHQQSLRWLFKFLNHMMSHTGGNFDRLMRNLLDSQQLLSSLRTVLSNAKTFGSTVWSMAVTILTSFINNEPTSYQVIAEAGLSDAFLETVAGEPASEAIAAANADVSASTPSTYPPREAGKSLAEGILPVAEAISTLPPAFDGICLAEAGMKLFQSSIALERFFEIFESPAHIKALDADTEMPTLIGNSSMSCELIARVVQLCAEKADKEGVGAKLWSEDAAGKLTVAGGRQALSGPRSQQSTVQASESTATDVEMKDADDTANEPVAYDQITETEDSTKGPTTGQYIRVLCRFLSGFFSNHAMCAAYVELDGVDKILDISSLACLYRKASEYRSMCEQFGHVVQVLVEQKPHIAVPSLIKRTQAALEHLQPLLDHTGKQAFFAPFTSSGTSQNTENLQRGTQYVKALVSAHTLVGAMTLTFQSQMYTTRSSHNVSSQVNLADMYARLWIASEGYIEAVYGKSCYLQRNMPTEWEKETRITSSGFGNDEPTINGDAAAPGSTSENPVASQNSAQFENTQTLRNLLTGYLPRLHRSSSCLLARPSSISSNTKSKESEIIEDRYAYWIVILTSLSQLIVEPNLDRSQAFLDAATRILPQPRWIRCSSEHSQPMNSTHQSALKLTLKQMDDTTSEETKRLLNLSLGGIKIILAFYSQIINFKLRYAVIVPVEKIWNSDLIDKATTVKASTERGRVSKIPKRSKPIIKPWSARNGDHLPRLKENGHEESLAEKLLYRCCDNFNMANEYCRYQARPGVSRNPIPQYEIQARGPPSTSPSRAEVVVPEHPDDASMTSSEVTRDEDGSEQPETQSVQMEDCSHFDLQRQKRLRLLHLYRTCWMNSEPSSVRIVQSNLFSASYTHEDVTFELADLISAAVSKAPDPSEMRGESRIVTTTSRNQGKKIAASAHLLALILQEKDFYDVIVEQLKEHFTTLLGFIKIFPDQSPEDSSPWIGQVLLIIERLLAEDQLPHQISWTPPTEESTEETTVDERPQPIVSVEEKDLLFNAIIEMLPRIGKDESLALSKKRIERLFLMVKELAGITNEGLRSAFMIDLRHMIEDDEMIRQIMRTEIQQMFESRDRRQQTRLATLARFTNEKLQLKGFDPNQRPQALMLKKTEPPSTEGASIVESSEVTAEADKPKESSEAPKQPFLERTKTSDLKLPVVENPDGVIHYLLCELLAYKEAEDKPEAAKPKESAPGSAGKQSLVGLRHGSLPAPAAASTEAAKPEKPVFKAEEHPIYIYRCFILKCLSELVQSYNRTKIEFINLSRKADPYTVTPSKPRSGVLNYLLNNVVPIGSLNHEGDLAFKKKLLTSNCAIDLIVSLCNKTGEFALPKTDVPISPYVETEPDLLFVRKFVLEHALKAFKDANASDEPLDMKYSRLLSIADIFSRMVSQRPNGEMLTQNADLTPNLKQMAKIMYEKNFVTILTTAISDIDLNFPNAKRVVKYILKPLKWLCYVAMDLSMHYDTSSAPDSADEYEISTASDDDLIGNGREETPDLFRNSTLGMFEAHESESDEDSEDEEGEEMMYDDPYADDMEYDEGDIGDDDVVSDDDEEILEMDIDGMGPIEGLPGDVDVEIELDDDGNAMGSDDDSEDDEEDDEDEDDDDMDDMDDDGDDGMDDMEEAMDAMEEVTGDDENASLAEDQEDDWSDDPDDFPGGPNGDANMPPGALGFVLDPPQLLEQMRQQGGDLEDFLDDNMEEEDMDDEEEEYDEDIHYDPGMEDDDDAMPEIAWGGGWEDPQPPTVRHTHRLSPWMFPAGPGDRILVPAYRSHRPGAGPRVTDDGINPLLQQGGASARRDGLPRNEGNSDWVHASRSNLLNAMSSGAGGPTLHQHGGALHLSFSNSMGMPPFDSGMRRDIARMRENYTSRTAREDPHSAVAFAKVYTSQRWQEEARILYGPAAIEKSNRVINSILKVMVPPAMEAAKKRLEERQAEVARKLKEEQEEKEKQEREERERREAQEKEDRERQEREAAEAASRAPEQPAEDESKAEPETAPEAQAMEGVEAGESSTQPAAAESTPAEPAGPPPQRITTMIRGHEYDITDLGIDTEYLDALPEDLREEVLMQQVAERRAEQRAAARRQEQAQQQSQAPAQAQAPAAPEEAGAAGEVPTDINEDFLAALPADIRAELLAQEAQERRRREREENRRRNQANAGAPPPQAEEMDPASFFASLDPDLRAAVLMDTDEDICASYHQNYLQKLERWEVIVGYISSTTSAIDEKKKTRPCVQMLDKAGVATLLRLMFIPQQGSAKGSLSSILRYVCENRQNRAEVISILLSILQDGSADVNAVEKSFAQLSIRAKQPQQPADKTPKISRKNGALSINADVSPLMVVQQCLNTLTQLTEKNPAVWQFFLTEHETGVGFKNRANRKGKAKETKANRYPVNALLTLLDRKLIVESSTIMEQLTTLLKVITAPLQVLKKEKEKAAEEAKKEAETSADGQATENQPADTAATEARPEGQDTEMTTASENAAQSETATAEGEGSTSKPDESKAEDDKTKKHRSLTPPDVPEVNLRLVAKILAARECNSKVFQETLNVISNLSPIPGAKEVFGQELLGIAKDLASSTLHDLTSLTVQVSKASSPTDVQGIALAKFSPASSDQTKLLRALTALDYLFDPSRDSRDKPESAAEALEPAQKEDILLTLYEDRAFAPLWEKLSECLTVIRQRGNMLNIATTLLPLIESLMVVCKNTTLKEMPLSKMMPKEFALSSPPPESRMENLFFNFTEEHRKILNDLVRQNPKLMSGTFSLLVKNSKVLEFDNKRNYFNRKLHSRGGDRQAHPPLQLSVRRDQVFLDSFKSLYFKSADEMKFGKLSIRFHGEEGMFNADYALFVPVASDRTTFHPNRLSSINPEHLMFFKFIGRIIGKALYEGRVLDCHFSRAVYKQIMGKQVSLKDMETLDLEYYKSLEWMIHNEITDIITETFSVEVEAFGEMQTVDLIENGRNIPVTEDNKHEATENFLKGFHDIVPAELVSIFSEQELELLISGLPDINVDDWKNNTEYHNYTAASPQIQWFWRAVRTFEKEEQASCCNSLLELEGMNGFSKFNIHRDYGSKDRLPSSHTCFNQLDLPEYETYEDLRKALYTAMTAGGEYFGFA